MVDPPRRVPGETYVEKYYQINPELRAAIRLDPTWYIQVQSSLTPEDRQALLVSVSLTMANLLRQAATRYSEMDAETLDQSIQEDQLAMTVIAWMGREQLRSRLERIRAVLEEEDREEAETVTRGTDVMLIAALPALWENETHQEREVSAQPPSSE